MTTMLLNRLHFPVRVLGRGVRAGIWFQGCSIGCRGCMSLDTWGARGIEPVLVDDVLQWLGGLDAAGIDGVTISGGEASEQPEALRALLDGLIEWRADSDRDVLVFSGRSAEWVRENVDLFRGADVVVAGPYVAEQAGTSALRGSENQELVVLSERGRRAYADLSQFPRSAVQLTADESGVWIVGIPLPDGLNALEEGLGEPARRTWR
jgi:anaerobic ribonucleoside-triphosphate reductase activating protein